MTLWRHDGKPESIAYELHEGRYGLAGHVAGDETFRAAQPFGVEIVPATAAGGGAVPGLNRVPAPARRQASRSIGQLMQRGPPRPRPSSPPGTVMTSMPFSAR